MCEKTVRVISFFCIAALVAQESNPLLGPLPTGSQNREESDGRHFSKQIPPTPPAFAKKMPNRSSWRILNFGEPAWPKGDTIDRSIKINL
ncbi:hypothetical protein CDAR_66831 [Caerostris darwini]|uniref:Secreted protein n=1 Tax=Caerostris darwini TaxID=1538125 RepID=A0AAV4PEE2_9ARAC|nr:hypothetical protein CDAR_408921 [Caerostris darwini]GIY74734.1 hypothetical protein CDAR_66831 [Caerostris darwini]